MKRILLAILISSVLLLLPACASPDLPPETQIDDVAVQQYASEVITQLDTLYGKFEDGEAYAKRISNEREAPYQMAIGYMAEVRAVADRIESKLVPSGAEEIRSITITKLRELQAGLDEIASKDASQVKLTDPNTFYTAYLDVLIEIPELKVNVKNLVP